MTIKPTLSLTVDNEEIWKSMESAEKTLSEMVSATDFDTTRFFVEEDKSAQRDPEAIVQEMKAKRQEIEDFYTKVCCLIFSDFFSDFF